MTAIERAGTFVGKGVMCAFAAETFYRVGRLRLQGIADEQHHRSPDMDAHQVSPIPYDGTRGPQENTLLIVDDNCVFLAQLARAMETRGFEVEAAASVRMDCRR